jgi:YVTN family beta-propeller protein
MHGLKSDRECPLSHSYETITPDGTTAYVVNAKSSSVSVIDTGTNTVKATVAVGTKPQRVAITPDGASAYVPNAGSNSVSVTTQGLLR